MSATQRHESDNGEPDADETDGAESAGAGPEAQPEAEQYIDEQEEDSFPASDPHSDWSGPPDRE